MRGVTLRCVYVSALLLGSGLTISAQESAKHPITFDDMIKLHRIAEPQVSRDGKWVAYTVSTPVMETNRGVSNIWVVSTAGGAAMQLTQSGHDSSPVWSPDGETLAFLSSRNGDSQVYLLSMEGGEAHALTKLSTGAEIVKWSPDGKEICFTAVTDKMEAISTNADLFVVPVSGGETKRITTQPGFDGNPVYSPDGKFIAYHAQLAAGYEADRWRVLLYDRAAGRIENLTETFDRSADELAWSPDSKTIYFTAENETQKPVYAMAARFGAEPKKIIADTYNTGISFSADGKTLVFERTSLTVPAEIFAAASDGSNVRRLTHQNDWMLSSVEMNAPETFWVDGAEGAKVQAMLIRPPKFDATKKYPLLA